MRSSTLIVLLLLLFAFSFQGCIPPEEETTTDTGGPVCTAIFEGSESGNCSYYSDVKSVDGMSGISYRLECLYSYGPWSGQTCGGDVCFRVLATNATDSEYLHTRTYFGIPTYTSSVDDAVGPNTGGSVVARYYHSSLDSKEQQCQEAYTGKIEFSYANKYGSKTGSTVATKEFDSTTLPLNF